MDTYIHKSCIGNNEAYLPLFHHFTFQSDIGFMLHCFTNYTTVNVFITYSLHISSLSSVFCHISTQSEYWTETWFQINSSVC